MAWTLDNLITERNRTVGAKPGACEPGDANFEIPKEFALAPQRDGPLTEAEIATLAQGAAGRWTDGVTNFIRAMAGLAPPMTKVVGGTITGDRLSLEVQLAFGTPIPASESDFIFAFDKLVLREAQWRVVKVDIMPYTATIFDASLWHDRRNRQITGAHLSLITGTRGWTPSHTDEEE